MTPLRVAIVEITTVDKDTVIGIEIADDDQLIEISETTHDLSDDLKKLVTDLIEKVRHNYDTG